MPGCGVELDYERGKQPNSAEPDHILPVHYGGRNEIENGRVICRRCNQSRGAGDRKEREAPRTVTSSPIW
jgi:5-methylcytosine-specific restriction endonuclease McrA